MNDLSIYESGNGGDVRLLGNDLETTDSYFNMPYLAWFGGNPGFNTSINTEEGEQNFDWFGNDLLMFNESDIQFNSLLENALNTIALDSNGRNLIENQAKIDLDFFSTFALVDVNVSIIDDDKVQIDLELTKPSNLDVKSFQFIWDATTQEVIENKIL